jgi:filamentous hemagglutinin
VQQAILRGDAAELEIILGNGTFSSGAEEALAYRALAAMRALGTQDARMLAERYGIDFANRINHVFGRAGHNLGSLVQEFGGSAARAFAATQRAVEAAYAAAGEIPTIVRVGMFNVSVEVVLNAGLVQIATAYIP